MLAWLLSLALVLSMTPVMGVYAADEEIGSWADLQAKIYGASDGETITLTQDLTGESRYVALTVPAGKTIALDLNGKTLSGGLSDPWEGGNVITVQGSLTV